METIQTSVPDRFEPLPPTPPTNFEDESDEESARNVKIFDMPPLYEKELFDRKFMRYHSLATNKVLKARWQAFKTKVTSNTSSTGPVQLPKNNELHFCNHMVRRFPETSSTNYRKNLKPGPGVDFAGQRPIPNELLMKRGSEPLKPETATIDKTNTGSVAVKTDVKKRGKQKQADIQGAKEKI